jgi:hypothetical protein
VGGAAQIMIATLRMSNFRDVAHSEDAGDYDAHDISF